MYRCAPSHGGEGVVLSFAKALHHRHTQISNFYLFLIFSELRTFFVSRISVKSTPHPYMCMSFRAHNNFLMGVQDDDGKAEEREEARTSQKLRFAYMGCMNENVCELFDGDGIHAAHSRRKTKKRRCVEPFGSSSAVVMIRRIYGWFLPKRSVCPTLSFYAPYREYFPLYLSLYFLLPTPNGAPVCLSRSHIFRKHTYTHIRSPVFVGRYHSSPRLEFIASALCMYIMRGMGGGKRRGKFR